MTVIIHHKGRYWIYSIRLIRILESLTAWGILRNSRSNMSLSSCLLFTLMKQHLDICTYKVVTHKEDDDLQLLISPFITARKIAGIHWVIFSCFSSVYNQILFCIFMLVLWLFNWDYESVSLNTKLNLIT